MQTKQTPRPLIRARIGNQILVATDPELGFKVLPPAFHPASAPSPCLLALFVLEFFKFQIVLCAWNKLISTVENDRYELEKG
jgi:hypothetical protein